MYDMVATISLLEMRQHSWLTRYVNVSLWIVLLMLVAEWATYLITPAISLISGTAWIASYGLVLVWARYTLPRGQLYHVANIVCGTPLLISLVAGFTNPEALTVLIQLPLIVLIAVLPFVSTKRFWFIFSLCFISIVGIILVGISQPVPVVPANIHVNVLLITGLETMVILSMLVQYQRWLADLVEQTEQTNSALEASKANLEQQIQQRTAELHERERRYRRLFEESLDVIYITNPAGQLLDINQAGLDLFGYTRAEFEQLDMARDIYVDPSERALFQQLIAEHGIVRGLETRRKHKHGHILYVEESAAAVRDEHGTIIAYQGFLHDVTARKHAEAELEENRIRLRQQVAELEQRSRQATLLNHMGEWLQACQNVAEACSVAAETLQQLVPNMAGAIYLRVAETEYFRCEQHWGHPDLFQHELIDDIELANQLLATTLNVPIRNDGRVIGMILFRGDITPLLATQLLDLQSVLGMTVRPFELAVTNLYLRESLQYQAIRDPLTGLFNRRYMAESLERELHRMDRHHAPLSLVMIDIDYFKDINDQYGHSVGDMVLHEVGQFLLQHVRAEDIACRYGGEEFMLILPDSALEHTIRRAEQIRQQTHELVLVHNLARITFTISLGIACFPIHGQTVSDLLLRADLALYQAKSLGRNQLAVAHAPRAAG